MGACYTKTEQIKAKEPEISCWDSMTAKWRKT